MMKMRVIVSILLLAGMAAAQRHKLTINAETPEGQLLTQIGTQEDPAEKLKLLEQFAGQHATHEAIGWVYSQMVVLYTKANQHDKVIDVAGKLLAIDPADAENAHAGLKAAEAKKDLDAIKTWAIKTSEAARKAVAAPKPEDEDEQEAWKRSVDYAKQVDIYSAYALYATSLQATDPAKKIEFMDTLKQQHPDNEYSPKLGGQYFLAYRQMGDTAKAVSVAEEVLKTDQSNEDMLLVVTDHYFNQKKEPDKVLAYTEKMVPLMESKAKPEGISDEDWAKKKTLILGLAHWMKGVTLSGQNKFGPADQALRAALPYLKDNEQMLAGAYFHLGLANYKLGDRAKNPDTQRILDAIKFNQQCAAINSPFQAQAKRNIAAIRSQYQIR